MTITQLSTTGLCVQAAEAGYDDGTCEQIRNLCDKAHARGDSVLVYENVDLSHPGMGDLMWVTYGSDACMLPASQFPEPPERMPDTPTSINWRYYLKGRCDG